MRRRLPDRERRTLGDHQVEPYGVDLAPALAVLAREQRPRWASRIFLANAITWQPPIRLDFVRTELVYVPQERQQAFVERLLRESNPAGG